MELLLPITNEEIETQALEFLEERAFLWGNEEKPTEVAINQILGKQEVKEKYPVNVVFDGELEQALRAKELGLGVATYIKSLVVQDLNNTK